MSPNDKAALSSIELHTPDISDGQVWVQSNIAHTTRMNRRTKESFTFSDASLVIISNADGPKATLNLRVVKAAHGIYLGSNRRAGYTLREGDTLTMLMKPGEAVTVRDLFAREPRSAGGATIRPGQSVVF